MPSKNEDSYQIATIKEIDDEEKHLNRPINPLIEKEELLIGILESTRRTKHLDKRKNNRFTNISSNL